MAAPGTFAIVDQSEDGRDVVVMLVDTREESEAIVAELARRGRPVAVKAFEAS